jgi:uncharacterized protein (DUF849 family)
MEVQSDFAKYLCVLVSGFLEKAVSALLEELAMRRSAPEVAAFVASELRYWMNPTTGKISDLLGSFSNAWRVRAEEFLVDEKKEHINSLVALRNKIAHGESVGTSLSQVKEYYKTTVTVVEFLADVIDPPQSP